MAIVTSLRSTAFPWLLLAVLGQVERPRAQEERATAPVAGSAVGEESAEIIADDLEIYDQAEEQSFVVGSLRRGDHVRIAGAMADGWLAIEPPPTLICWIPRSAIDPGADGTAAASRAKGASEPDLSPGKAVEVLPPGATIRAGNPQARMPGPPRGRISAGTRVRLARRPPLQIGQGQSAAAWYAIEPPPAERFYIRAEGTKAERRVDTEKRDSKPEYLAARYAPPPAVAAEPENLPAGIAAEIAKIEAIEQTIVANHPIEDWRFDSVRSRFQAVLKSAGQAPDVEDAIRRRLARVTQYEQAAQAARQIQTILARSHGRDREVAEARRRIAAAGRTHARAFAAVGYMQPCSQKVEGRKLYVLISNNGSTLAYLDIPPGLDPDPLLASRVGVRGVPHYSEDLGARLITVRDLETRR